MLQYYHIDFEKLKEVNFESLGPFLLDRVRKKEVLFHFIRSGPEGYTILAANQGAIKYATDQEFPNIKEDELLKASIKQDKNVKLNEIAIEVLSMSRSLLRTPGDEGILNNNSDLIIDMVLFLKELFSLFGLPVAYWKQFINISDDETISKIRKLVSQAIMTKKG
jgi:hypothetical protein